MAVIAALATASLVGFGVRALLALRWPIPPGTPPPSIPPAANTAGPRPQRRWMDALATAARKAVPASRESTGRLRLRLAQAGIDVPAPVYHGISVSIVTCGLIVALLATSLLPQEDPAIRLAACAGMAGATACIPRAYLDMQARRRRKAIEAALPATLETLAVAVEAGLTLERAFRSVARRRTDVLARELATVDEDISLLGYTRDQALRRLAWRCSSEDLALFASAVSVSSKAGAPVASILKRQAAAARIRRYQRLEAEANRIPTKMIFPLAFLVMPGVFIVAISPAVISIAMNTAEVL